MKSPSILDQNSGFTLVEMLVGIGIFVVILGLGLFLSFDFYRGYSFRYERNVVVNILERARGKALANINQSPHGISIDPPFYVVFQGSSYDNTNPLNERIPAARGITVSGLPSVVFSQLNGDVATAGDIILTDGIRSSTISINNEGRINW